MTADVPHRASQEPRPEGGATSTGARLALPLHGILVADFSRVLAGPLASLMLADLGARVIKVERPGLGDDTRQWGPPYSATSTTYFESVNRSKESVTLDLRTEKDRERALTLCKRADVLIENFKPGTMETYGLGYDELSRHNDGLIYASVTGFGSAQGADLPGYDFVVQALGGLMSITGDRESGPMKAGVALVDVLTGKDAVVGILAALQARHVSGKGARLEVNLLSSLQGALVNQAQAYLSAGVVPSQMGNLHPSIAPYELLRCQDGNLAVACGNDNQFRAMTCELGAPELGSDDRFSTNAARVTHREALRQALENLLAKDTVAQWQRRFNASGVPAGAVLNVPEGLEFAASLGLNPTVTAGGTEFVRHPVTYDRPFVANATVPPTLGQHNQEVLEWLDRT